MKKRPPRLPKKLPSLKDLSVLTDQERRMIQMRFGLGGGKPHTVADVGAAFGVTKTQAQAIQNRALRKIANAEDGAQDLIEEFAGRADRRVLARALGHQSRRAILRELIRRKGSPVSANEMAKMCDQVPSHFVGHAEALMRLRAIELLKKDEFERLPGARRYRLSPGWLQGTSRSALVSVLSRKNGAPAETLGISEAMPLRPAG